MRAELVRVIARDGLELAGYYVAPEGGAKRAVLHTHGLAGNFYENRFISDLSEAVVAKGLAFLATNNRGHDYVSDNLKGEGADTTYHPGGSTREIFEECVHDVGGGADFLAERGHREIYFEGHSLGCSKIVYYLTEERDTRAVGLILISPPEMFGLHELRSEEKSGELLETARALVVDGRGDELVDAGRDMPYSAKTIVSMYGDSSATDIFPFRLGDEGEYTRLASIALPIFVAYGTEDEAAACPVGEAVDLIARQAVEAPIVESIIVRGANHVYWGHEDELARGIVEFLVP